MNDNSFRDLKKALGFSRRVGKILVHYIKNLLHYIKKSVGENREPNISNKIPESLRR